LRCYTGLGCDGADILTRGINWYIPSFVKCDLVWGVEIIFAFVYLRIVDVSGHLRMRGTSVLVANELIEASQGSSMRSDVVWNSLGQELEGVA
jgi:hypothetical protein